MSLRNIAVLMTCFNRRQSTLKSLRALFSQRLPPGVHCQVFLLDDGSKDGTGTAVRAIFPRVRLLCGDGTHFWNGGMRKAFQAAMAESFDSYLFLNDDTILYHDALARAIACSASIQDSGAPPIVVGSVRSHETGAHSYGGILKRVSGLALKYEKISPHPYLPIPCDTLNGNFALIPNEVADVIGNLEPRFKHQFGDLDYGLRATRAGFRVMLMPGYIGECNPNAIARSWRDATIPFAQRWKHLVSPKGVPFSEWHFFVRRHYGWRWPFYAVSPYLKTIAFSVLARVSQQASPQTAMTQR